MTQYIVNTKQECLDALTCLVEGRHGDFRALPTEPMAAAIHALHVMTGNHPAAIVPERVSTTDAFDCRERVRKGSLPATCLAYS